MLCLHPPPAGLLQLQRALRLLGISLSQDEVALLIKEIDADGDGEVR